MIKEGPSAMPRVLLIEPTIRPLGVEMLQAEAEVAFAPDGREETLIEHLSTGRHDAVITRVEKITRRVLEAAVGLRVVGQHGVGVDNIDVAAASEHGVLVLNAPTANAVSVAEHAVLLILALSRHLVEADKAVRAGDFQHRDRHLPIELNGKSVFVVGFGRAGRETARRLRLALNMRVLAFDPALPDDVIRGEGAEPASLHEGFAAADVVSLHLPHLPTTTGLVSAELLAAMKPSAYLVNTARGPVVDQAALVAALESGGIAGAGLDVFDPEPPCPDDPLLKLPNVIVSPHFAGDTADAKDRCSQLIVRQVLTALAGGLPEHIVNRTLVAERLKAPASAI